MVRLSSLITLLFTASMGLAQTPQVIEFDWLNFPCGEMLHCDEGCSACNMPSGGTSLLWVNPELKKGKYTAIMIDPIGLYPRPPLLAKVSKGRMLEALTYIHTRAVNQLGSTLKIVDKPGPGVLRLDAAITGVKTTAEKDKLHDAKNIPVAMIFADMSPATAQPEQSLVVFLEARLRDSQTNKTLVKAVRAGTGSPAGKDKVTVEQMKPVLNSWVQDADAFVRESVK